MYPVEFRIVSENRLPPGRPSSLIESLSSLSSPFPFLCTRQGNRPVNERGRLCHMCETLLVNNEVRAECVQQDKEIMVAKLDRRRRQKDHCFRVVTEKPHGLVAERILIPDMVRLVYDDQIEARGWVQIQQTLFAFSLAVRARAIEKDFVE